MKEQLMSILIPIGTFLAGVLGSVSLLFIVKKIIKKSLVKFIEKVLTPKAEEVSSDKRLARMEKELLEIKKELLEIRGKRK